MVHRPSGDQHAESFVLLNKLWNSDIRSPLAFNGTHVIQTDTKRIYAYTREFPHIVAASQDNVVDRGWHEHQDSSVAHLFGHEFARTTPTEVYTFDSMDREGDHFDMGDLTPVNVNFVRSTNVNSLSGYGCAELPAGSYLHKDAPSLLGNDSFLIGGWFRSNRIASNETLFTLGDAISNHVRITINSSDRLRIRVHGSGGSLDHFIEGVNFYDSDWHYMGMLINKNTNKGMFIMTNGIHELSACSQIFDIPDIGSVDHLMGSLVIGGINSENIKSGAFQGYVSNFQIYQWSGEVDYNVLPLVISGIRDGCARNVTITHNHDITKRLNNDTIIDGDDGSYTYTTVNLDEGLYDVFLTSHQSTDSAQFSLFVDGIDQGRFQTYTSVPFNNDNVFINQVKLHKGVHFVKILLHEISQTPTVRLRLSQLKFNKIDGSNDGGTSNLLILGDELKRRSQALVLSASNGNHFTNELKHVEGTTPLDGSYAEGEIYTSSGLWNLTLHHSLNQDAGIMELLINGNIVAVSDGFGTGNSTVTKYVRFAQGRNTIRVQINGKNADSTGYRMIFHAIRAELQSNTSFCDTTIVTGADDDNEIITGAESDHNHLLDSNALFGNQYRIRDTSESARKRWFTGGLYRVNYHIRRHVDGGTQDINVDDIPIFENINFSSSEGQTAIISTIVKIPRGYHDIIFNNLSGTLNVMSYLRFSLIGKLPISSDSKIQNESGLIRIGEYRARREESSTDINFERITPEKYDRVMVQVNGRSLGSLTMAMVLNDITVNNYRRVGVIRYFDDSQTPQTVNSTESHLTLISPGMISNTHTFTVDVDLIFGAHPTDNFSIANKDGSATTHVGYENFGWLLTGTNVNFLEKLTFTATGSNWHGNTKITVYARERTG